jgi:hypothetical protein
LKRLLLKARCIALAKLSRQGPFGLKMAALDEPQPRRRIADKAAARFKDRPSPAGPAWNCFNV